MSDAVILGANWYVDTINQRKRLERCKLPSLNKAREDFVLGGGFFRASMPMEIEALEATFSLRGSHDDVRSLFGREPGDYTTFYYYERLRNIERGDNTGRVVILKGLVNAVEQPQVQGKRADVTNYTIGSIVLYHDILNGRSVHKMDFFANQLIIQGVDYTQSHNALIAA